METTTFLHGPEETCMRGALNEDDSLEASVFLVEQGDPTSSSEHATPIMSEETQVLHYYCCGHIGRLAILVSIAVFMIFAIIGYAAPQLPSQQFANGHASSADNKVPQLLQEGDNDDNADITHVTTPALLHPSQPPFAKGNEESDNDVADLFGSPFVVFTEGGCSGTTAIGGYIRKIVRAHGFDYLKGATFEFLHTNKNPRQNKSKNKFYNEILKEKHISAEDANYEEVMVESIKRAQAKATEAGVFFFFKADIGRLRMNSGLKNGLDSLRASYSGVYRWNVLDRCICEIRDCFSAAKDFGFPVFAANGTRTDLCFERREHPEIRIQARITDGHGCIAYGEKLVQEVQRYSPNSSVTAEHLFEFESSSDEDAFESSIDQWMVFLRPLLKQHLSRHVIEQVLEGHRGSWLASSSQESKVYDYDELKNELEDTDEDMNFIHGD